MDILNTLDFSKFISGTELERAELAKELVESFKQHGFAKLINHGVKDEQVSELFKWVSLIASLPVTVFHISDPMFAKERQAIRATYRREGRHGQFAPGCTAKGME